MAYLLRMIKRRAPWSTETPAASRRPDALADFRRREQDTDGLSVWRYDSEHEKQLVLAEIACRRERVEHVDYLEVPEEVVAKLGVVTPSPAQTLLPSASALHHSLDWSNEQLELLVDVLFGLSVASRRATTQDVRAALLAMGAADLAGAPDDIVAWVERVRG